MDPFNFADAILGILAQRLVRTLCKSCRKEYNPSRDEYDELIREYGPEDFEKNVNIIRPFYFWVYRLEVPFEMFSP